MIETGYSLRKMAPHYLVGGNVLDIWYQLREMLFRMNQDTANTTRYVADRIILIRCRYGTSVSKRKKPERSGLCSRGSWKMEPVYRKLDELAVKLTAGIKAKLCDDTQGEMQSGIIAIQFTFEQTDGYEPSFFYDLLFFWKTWRDMRMKWKEIEALLKQAIVNSYIGIDFKKGKTTGEQGVCISPFWKGWFLIWRTLIYFIRTVLSSGLILPELHGEFLYAIKKRSCKGKCSASGIFCLVCIALSLSADWIWNLLTSSGIQSFAKQSIFPNLSKPIYYVICSPPYSGHSEHWSVRFRWIQSIMKCRSEERGYAIMKTLDITHIPSSEWENLVYMDWKSGDTICPLSFLRWYTGVQRLLGKWQAG